MDVAPPFITALCTPVGVPRRRAYSCATTSADDSQAWVRDVLSVSRAPTPPHVQQALGQLAAGSPRQVALKFISASVRGHDPAAQERRNRVPRRLHAVGAVFVGQSLKRLKAVAAFWTTITDVSTAQRCRWAHCISRLPEAGDAWAWRPRPANARRPAPPDVASAASSPSRKPVAM